MSSQLASQKQSLWVDCEAQAAILIRTSIYGLTCSLYFGIALVFTQCMNEQDQTFWDSCLRCAEDIVYWLPGFLLLAPIAAYDLLKLTNQFASPIVRLRDEMKLFKEGLSDRPLSFRETDPWADLNSSYNQIRGELLQLRKQLSEQPVSDHEVSTLPTSFPVHENAIHLTRAAGGVERQF